MNLTLPTPARVIAARRLVDVALMNLQRTYDMKTPTPENKNALTSELTDILADALDRFAPRLGHLDARDRAEVMKMSLGMLLATLSVRTKATGHTYSDVADIECHVLRTAVLKLGQIDERSRPGA